MTSHAARRQQDLYGPCWCCARYGIITPAVSTVGLCRPCGGRSPSACAKAHTKPPTRK